MKYLELKEYHDGLLLDDLEKLDQNNNKCTKMLTLDEFGQGICRNIKIFLNFSCN